MINTGGSPDYIRASDRDVRQSWIKSSGRGDVDDRPPAGWGDGKEGSGPAQQAEGSSRNCVQAVEGKHVPIGVIGRHSSKRSADRLASSVLGTILVANRGGPWTRDWIPDGDDSA